jgi:hypothetical protein
VELLIYAPVAIYAPANLLIDRRSRSNPFRQMAVCQMPVVSDDHAPEDTPHLYENENIHWNVHLRSMHIRLCSCVDHVKLDEKSQVDPMSNQLTRISYWKE